MLNDEHWLTGGGGKSLFSLPVYFCLYMDTLSSMTTLFGTLQSTPTEQHKIEKC